jgi:uncharacterized protein (DUF433 family)
MMVDLGTASVRLVGVGIYTVKEAARLVGANAITVSRWLRGYRFPTKWSGQGQSPPLFHTELPEVEGKLAIGFLDLIELLFIKAFRSEGVSLPTIRLAARKAAKKWKNDHPFCLKRFATDGRTIFATVADGLDKDQVLELTRSQLGFKSILNPYLKNMDYSKLGVDRWWPLGKDKVVFLDPRIAFGKPVVTAHNVPTESIWDAVRVNRSLSEVAKWFDLPVSEVQAAVDFEMSRAA